MPFRRNGLGVSYQHDNSLAQAGVNPRTEVRMEDSRKVREVMFTQRVHTQTLHHLEAGGDRSLQHLSKIES
jgi:hypothetical protein